MARFDQGFIRSSDPRKRDLAAIHALAHQLGLDRDAYKDVLRSVTGAESSAQLDGIGRRKLIAHLRSKLPQAKRVHHPGAPHNIEQTPMLGKIEALLADAQRPWTYAEALAQRICHRDRLAFCSNRDLGKIIAALSYDAARRERRTRVADVQ